MFVTVGLPPPYGARTEVDASVATHHFAGVVDEGVVVDVDVVEARAVVSAAPVEADRGAAACLDEHVVQDAEVVRRGTVEAVVVERGIGTVLEDASVDRDPRLPGLDQILVVGSKRPGRNSLDQAIAERQAGTALHPVGAGAVPARGGVDLDVAVLEEHLVVGAGCSSGGTVERGVAGLVVEVDVVEVAAAAVLGSHHDVVPFDVAHHRVCVALRLDGGVHDPDVLAGRVASFAVDRDVVAAVQDQVAVDDDDAVVACVLARGIFTGWPAVPEEPMVSEL